MITLGWFCFFFILRLVKEVGQVFIFFSSNPFTVCTDSHFFFWKENSLDINSPQLQFSSWACKHKGTVIPRICAANLTKSFLLIWKGDRKEETWNILKVNIKSTVPVTWTNIWHWTTVLASLVYCKQLNLTVLTAPTENAKPSEITCDLDLGWHHGVMT